MSEVVACPSCGKRNRVPVVAAGTPGCASCRAALLVRRNGRPVATQVGALPADRLVAWVRAAVAND